MKIVAKNLTCIRAEKNLFRKVNFELCQGQCLLIQGPNGAGKSSLLKIVAGLMVPDKGHIFWNDQNITQASASYYAHMSYLGHKDGLKKALTPYENIVNFVALGEKCCSYTKIQEVLSSFRLEKYHHTPCQYLSAGERRKVILAGILLSNKKLWILDEPFTALDSFSIQWVLHLFGQHLANGGMIIIASHLAIKELEHQTIDLAHILPTTTTRVTC